MAVCNLKLGLLSTTKEQEEIKEQQHREVEEGIRAVEYYHHTSLIDTSSPQLI